MATKKAPSQKGKAKSSVSRQKSQKKREEQSRQQFWAIVVFAVAIFIEATTLIKGQNVWNWIHNFFLGMFGWSAYLIAPLLFYISIMTALDRPIGLIGHKVWQSMLLICLLSGATQVFGSGIPNGNLLEKFLFLFQNGVDGHGGGFISAIFGLPLMYWFGTAGARVTMVLLIFVLVMVLTGGTLLDLYQSAQKPVKKMEEVYIAHSEIRSQRHQVAEEQALQNGESLPPAKPKFTFPIFDMGKSEKGSVNNESFLNAKQKREEELLQLQISQEQSSQNRMDWIENPSQEKFQQKQNHRTKESSPPKPGHRNLEPMSKVPDEKNDTITSPYLDDLIDRVTFSKPSLEKEDQTVIHSLKVNLPPKRSDFPEDLADPMSIFSPHAEPIEYEAPSAIAWENAEELGDGFLRPEPIHLSSSENSVDAEESSEIQDPIFFDAEALLEDSISSADDFLEDYENPSPTSQRKKTSHEIIEVPADQAAAQGMTLAGASHSDGEIEEAEPEEIPYVKPPIDILNEVEHPSEENLHEELRGNAEKLVNTLQSFGVQTRIIDIARGPAVTRYELQPSAGVKISKITNLADDIALNLAASGVRIEAPIPNKPAVGIEVPNKVVSTVSIREIIDSPEFEKAKSPLAVALGRDIAGKVTVADLAKMPHTLIAGSTGSGKSVCINSLIVSMLYHSTPEEVKLVLIDPKMVELGIYNGIPHLLIPVVTDPKKAAGALSWAVNEMLNRYQYFKEYSVRDMAGFNRAAEKNGLKPMPHIVIIIDELADLMMAAPGEVEDSICRLAQMARAAGMHLVIATQRPSVDVITGVIKANIPSRIAFAVSSQIDSRTILDSSGAEKLLGRGDMLFSPIGSAKPTRVQGCFVTDGEVERIIDFIKLSSHQQTYDEKILEEIDRHAVADHKKKGGIKEDGDGFSDDDEMLPSAIETVVQTGQASTSMLQRKLKLGYARASRLMDTMEERGIIGPFEGSKPRQVLISKERWMEMKMISAAKAEDNKRNY